MCSKVLEGASGGVCVEMKVRDFFRGPEGPPEKISAKNFRSQKSRLFQSRSHLRIDFLTSVTHADLLKSHVGFEKK